MADRLTREELERYLADLRKENEWRREADKACAYYDGNQLSAKVVQQMQDLGLAPLVRNLVAPNVRLVLGMEAKTQRDWRVVGERDEDRELSEALGAELKVAERASRADRAISRAYASQIKAGIGWVEVARESDPFKYKYRVSDVHRREMFWDWRAVEEDLSDARYLVRRKWYDADLLKTWFPQKAKLVDQALHGWADWDQFRGESSDTLALARAFEEETRTTLEEAEWRDTERKRLILYEVWYRHWKRGVAMRLPDGSTSEFNPDDLRQALIVAMGQAELISASFPVIRLAWWLGPHQIADVPSPYPHNRFPYIPFWGEREDNTGNPYGLVRAMMSPQDEINARLSKMMWLLSAKRIIADSDSVDMPWKQVAEEAARPDAVILLNPTRKNKTADAFRVESDFGMSAEQFKVLQDATRAIQDAAGIHFSLLGKETGAESGIAINSLVEQGATTLAAMNDNYRIGRKLVGELLLSLIKEDLAGRENHSVLIERDGKRRTVTLNQPAFDESLGITYLSNSVAQCRTRVELEDVPQTPAYRMQQFQVMSEIAKSLPPELQPLFADFMVLASDMPGRREMAERIRGVLNLPKPPEEMTPEEQAEAQQRAAAAQEAEQLALAEQRTKVEETAAKTQKLLAEVQHLAAKIAQVEADTDKTQAETVVTAEEHQFDTAERSLALAQNADAPTERERFKAEQKKPRG